MTLQAKVVSGDQTYDTARPADLTATPGGRLRVDSATGVVDSTGATFDPDSLAQTLTYNGDGTVATIAATEGTNTWTQTFGYTSGNLTSISKWVKA